MLLAQAPLRSSGWAGRDKLGGAALSVAVECCAICRCINPSHSCLFPSYPRLRLRYHDDATAMAPISSKQVLDRLGVDGPK